MICVNELSQLKCNKRQVLTDLIKLIAPFAPFIAEELWEALGNSTTVCDAKWPEFNEDYLKEDSITYSISFNGKTRFTMDFAADASQDEIQAAVLANEKAQSYIDGKPIRKVIVVPRKIVNIVL